MNKKEYTTTIVPYNATGIGFPASLPLNKIFMAFLKKNQDTLTSEISLYKETNQINLKFKDADILDGKFHLSLHMAEVEDRKENYGRTYDALAKTGAIQVYVKMENGDVIRTNLFDICFSKGSMITVRYVPYIVDKNGKRKEGEEMVENVEPGVFEEWKAVRDIRIIDMTYKYPPRNPHIRVGISLTVARYLLDIRNRYGLVLNGVVHNTKNPYLPQVYNYLSVRRMEKKIEVPYTVVRQNIFGVEIPELNVQKYSSYGQFRAYCLEPVRREMKRMFEEGTCDIYFEYTEKREHNLKIGVPKSIIFTVTYENQLESLSPEKNRLAELMNQKLSINISSAKELIKEIHPLQLSIIEDKIAELHQYCIKNKSIKSVGSYCFKAMQEYVRELKRRNIRENKTEEVLDSQLADIIFLKEQDIKRQDESIRRAELWKETTSFLIQQYPIHEGITKNIDIEFVDKDIYLKFPRAAVDYMERHLTEMRPYIQSLTSMVTEKFNVKPTLVSN